MFLSDGGPDFNPSHLANSLFYYRLFKELDADIFGVMTFAARYSTYNAIQHLWASLSNRLSFAVFSPIADGDSMAPAQQHGLTESEILKKEFEVFDSAIYDIAEKHWQNMTFDEYPVDVEVVPRGDERLLFGDFHRVKECLKSPLRNLHGFSDIIKEFKEIHAHIDRHLNEIIFSKGNDRSCCSSFKSKMVQKFFDGNVKFQVRSESDVEGHYKTFIQEVSNTCKKFSDDGQPTREEKALGKCKMRPSFGFKSQSEKDRHVRMFHRRQKTTSISDGKCTCSFESCKRVFNSQPSLSRHQNKESHGKRHQPA